MAKVITKKPAPLKSSNQALKKSSPPYGYFLICGIFILVGINNAYTKRWVGDDIFIGLRYIENFLNGHGLIYNPGERVEGYTDFLWLMIVSFFQWLKFEPVTIVITLGIICSGVVLVTIMLIGLKLNKFFNHKLPVPMALMAVALNFDYGVWSTSGLEPAFYLMLMTVAFYIFFFSDLSRNRRIFLSGLLLCFAVLTRPDAMIFIGLANLFLLLSNIIQKKKIGELMIEQLKFIAPVILIYVPYFLWRYNYYGEIFPNTYYSKVGYKSAWARGFAYIWLYLQVYFSSILFFVASVFLFFKYVLKSKFKETFTRIIGDRYLSGILFAIVTTLSYLFFFVAKVGGDFMYARFMMPCIPFLYLIIEYAINVQFQQKNGLRLFLLILIPVSVLYESTIRKDFFLTVENGKPVAREKEYGVADERYVYLYQYVLMNDKKIGLALAPYVKDMDITILMRGGQACFSYYAKFKTCVENHGLTDSYIAHMPVTELVGKVGHEHSAPYDYMLKREVDFVFRRSLYKNFQYRMAYFNLGALQERAEIIVYHRSIIKQLKERMGENFHFTDFEAFLDNYINYDLRLKSKEEVEKDYKEFKDYYFLHNDDKVREQKFIDRISS